MLGRLSGMFYVPFRQIRNLNVGGGGKPPALWSWPMTAAPCRDRPSMGIRCIFPPLGMSSPKCQLSFRDVPGLSSQNRQII